jgi:hypothetical protein
MKKILITLAILSIAAASYAQMAGGRSPTAVRDPEASKAVVALEARATALEAKDVALQAEVDAIELVANAAIPAASFAQVDTNEVADATLFTPDFVGQLLIGSESNLVWVAGGTTTNDWILLTVTE